MDQSSSSDRAPVGGLRLATAPVNWNNNDIPGWLPRTPFPEILDFMQDAGYSATEYDESFGTDAASLRNEADAWDMTWCGSYQWVDFLDNARIDVTIRALEHRLELLQEIGCEHLIVADSLRLHRVAMAGRVPSDGSASLDETDMVRIANSVHRLAEAASEYGISVHYHNHVGTWVEAPHEVDALRDQLDLSVVDFCFDTGHYAYGGGDASAFVREHPDAIGYIHLKDVDTDVLEAARAEELTFIDALKRIVFSPIGTGSANVAGILETLVDNGFGGWVVVEQDTCEGDPTQVARQNLKYITDWLSEHGAAVTTGR
jgi:inosose dehydratase